MELAMIKTILKGLKRAATFCQESGKMELYQRIIEAKEKILGKKSKLSELEGENRKLKEALKIKDYLEFGNNAYWVIKEKGQKDGPFCARCHKGDQKLIRLTPTGYNFYKCPKCRNGFQV